MVFHAFTTGSKVPAPRGCAAVIGENWKGIDGWRTRSGQGHKMRLEKVQLNVVYRSDRFCIEMSGSQHFFPNGVLTFAVDQQTVLGTVLELITCAESDGRHDRNLDGHPYFYI